MTNHERLEHFTSRTFTHVSIFFFTLRNNALFDAIVRVPYLLFRFSTGPSDQRPRSGFRERITRLARRRFLFVRGRTGGPSAALTCWHIGAWPPLQTCGIVGIPGKNSWQRQKRTEYFLHVDVVLRRTLQHFYPESRRVF